MPGPRRGLVVAAVTVLLISWPGLAAAIYEDQAGTFDWYKQFVGRPESVAFTSGKERVYLHTEQDILVSLQTKTGSVAWRRQYTEEDSLDGIMVLQTPAIVLAASRAGKTLRAWDALEGGFRWEAVVYEGPPVASSSPGACGLASVRLEGHKHAAVAVAAGHTLKLLGASKGEQLWSTDLPDASADTARKLLLAQDDIISLVGYTPGSSEVVVASYTAADGSSSGEVQQLTAAAALSATSAISGSSIAVLSADGQQLCVLADPGGAGELVCEQLHSLAPALVGAGSEAGLQLAAAAPGSFSLSSPAGVTLLSVSSGGVLQQVHWSAGPRAATPAATVGSSSSTAGTDSIMALVAASADANSFSVQLISAASGEELAAAVVSIPAPTHPTSGPAATVVAAWLDASRRSTAGSSSSSDEATALSGCKLLVLWSDGLLSFVEDGEVAWSREEALATVSSSLLVELPSARAAAAGDSEETSSSSSVGGGGASKAGGLLGFLQDKQRLRQWMRLQVLGVYVQFKLNTDLEKEEFYELRQALSDNNLPYRDTNGFRKLIVVLTSGGKVFGLHSGDGRILWASTAAALPAGSSSSSSKHQYLRLWRRFHDLTHAPQVAVLTTGGLQSSVVTVLNGHTGQRLQETELPYSVDKVIAPSTPVHDGAAEQFSFLLVEPTADAATVSNSALPRVHLLPDLPAVQQALANSSSDVFFWLLQPPRQDTEAGADPSGQQQVTVLRGFSLAPGAAPDAEGLLPVVPAWQVALPGQLLDLASRDPTEPVHSYVKILGDRSLKYKYINPNLLFTATAPSSPQQPASAEDQHVSVALINTVTGAVLHQQLHTGAAGPVHAVVSEHWVVYTFRDIINLRQQVTVIELYDASPRDLSIESIMLGRTQHAERLSSYRSMQLEVLSQSFYLQHSITGLDVSQTLQGIATKQLLLHTQHNQVYALDRRYLDPRRPLTAKVTPQEAEEGLVPYSELIIYNTLAYPTQDKQVLNLRGVTSVPAVLESTSLLFCYGTDLLFTRITPAAHFDSLQSDFSYGLLVVAMLVLMVLTLVVRRSSEQSMLKAKWQ